MNIYVDIDETICHTPRINGKSAYHLSVPIEENIEKINRFFDLGNHITYWTARGGDSGLDWTDITMGQLQEWKCKYHELKMGKPPFDMLIDDKAFNIDNV